MEGWAAVGGGDGGGVTEDQEPLVVVVVEKEEVNRGQRNHWWRIGQGVMEEEVRQLARWRTWAGGAVEMIGSQPPD